MHLPDFITTRLLALLRRQTEHKRPPDRHIGGVKTDRLYAPMNYEGPVEPREGTPVYVDTYMERWHVIPRNKRFNVYFHRFLRSDDDRALHDHPWWNVSLLLAGRYMEVLPVNPKNPAGKSEPVLRKRGEIVFRRPEHSHRVLLLDGVDGNPMSVWTLFITGPVVRSWGFHCRQGFVHWKKFTGADKTGDGYSGKGPGCGED